MAITSICAKIIAGMDVACLDNIARKYYQDAVLINMDDIDRSTVVVSLPDPITGACTYSVEFALNTTTTGYGFTYPGSGSSVSGWYDKSKDANGFAIYKHNTQILMLGVTEEAKCILHGLDKGNFAVALQSTDGTVEIYGISNGLTTGDYTYNIQEGSGGTLIVLSSLDISPESNLPLVYKSAIPGNETVDFDARFANP